MVILLLFSFLYFFIINKLKRKILRFVGFSVLFLLLLSVLLSISGVQTYLASLLTNRLNEQYHTNISVKKVDLSFLGSVSMQEIVINDHHKDTLIYVEDVTTSLLGVKNILDSKLDLGSTVISGAKLNMKIYSNETHDNLNVFVNSFSSKKSNNKPFKMNVSEISIHDFSYAYINENSKVPLKFSLKEARGTLKKLLVEGPKVSASIKKLQFVDNRGLKITNLTTNFLYTTKQMLFEDLILKTYKTQLFGDVVMSYSSDSFSDFFDKVVFDAKFTKSMLSVSDAKKFYRGLGGSDIFYFNGKFKGVLNQFALRQFNLQSSNGIRLKGNMSFKNSFDKHRGFYFNGKLQNFTSNYQQLMTLLPNVLKGKIPTVFDKIGVFSLKGNVETTPKELMIDCNVNSELGGLITQLKLSNINDIDNAQYDGKVTFDNFHFGKFLGNKFLGEVSLQGDVKGTGFKIENLNTRMLGNASKFNFKGYDYQNIRINGLFQNKRFNGNLVVNDTNCKLKFNGLADFSTIKNKFDFKANLDHINLNKTNLFRRDSLSVLKGNVNINLTGNSLNTIDGKAFFTNVNYRNEKDNYEFKKFEVQSEIKDSVQTVKINSKDIIEGQLSGKFLFEELVPVAQNALGSIYTNFTPYKVTDNQYVNFNFTIHNKIIEVFLPEVSVSKNTNIKGSINSSKQLLKLVLKTPKINAYGTEIKQLLLRTDNQNTLYNSHLTADKISNKYYEIHKLNLLNRTKNDTLFFKSVFKGGTTQKEKYSVDFYFTINPDKMSVLGFQTSKFHFKGNDWVLNPTSNHKSKVTFDIHKDTYIFDKFKFAAKNQDFTFSGGLYKEDKSLKASFNKVKLSSILPQLDSLNLEGKLSGDIDFKQIKGLYKPKSDILIEDFSINNLRQGTLSLKVKGNNSYKNYAASLILKDKKSDKLIANGAFDFSTKKPKIDFKVSVDRFSLVPFSPMGKDVISNLRGDVSGLFYVSGLLKNPDMDGMLSLKDGGLKIPYLNTDYDLKGTSIIRLKNQEFSFRKVIMEDIKHKTQGFLSGGIGHRYFSKWFLDLEIDTDNLLILDTKETEELPYYGTGFLQGAADIFGLTEKLTINVNGTTNKGTKFVIPLKDVQTVENYKLIRFKKKEVLSKSQIKNQFDAFKGLTLNMNLDVTKDAEAEVVIDKTNGSSLNGSGTGNLDIFINSRGKFTMNGNFVVDKGSYNFKYGAGGIISKSFKVEKGGTITWSGNPFDADLDITAKYRARANPTLLLDNFASTSKIPVDLIVKITGGLFNSNQQLDINIPNVNSTVASELDFKLNNNTANQKNLQFLSLLIAGNFVNPDKMNFNANQIAINTISELISGKVGNLQLGLGYDAVNQREVEAVNTGEQFNVSLGAQLSNRILFNGKVGVPVGGNNQSNIIGEGKIEVLLNEKGTLRANFFNRQNEFQFNRLQEGYTQGLGLSYQVNFDNFKGLLNKLKSTTLINTNKKTK